MANPLRRTKKLPPDPEFDANYALYQELCEWSDQARTSIADFTNTVDYRHKETLDKGAFISNVLRRYTTNPGDSKGRVVVPQSVIANLQYLDWGYRYDDIMADYPKLLEGTFLGVPSVSGLGLGAVYSEIVSDKAELGSVVNRHGSYLGLQYVDSNGIPVPVRGEPYNPPSSITDKDTRDSFTTLVKARASVKVVEEQQLPQLRKDREAYAVHVEAAAALEGPNVSAQAKLAELDETIKATEERVTQMVDTFYQGLATLQASVRQAKRLRVAKKSAQVLSETDPTRVTVAELDLEALQSLVALEGEKATRLEELADAIELGEDMPSSAQRITVKRPGADTSRGLDSGR